jgi:hypothetical protein
MVVGPEVSTAIASRGAIRPSFTVFLIFAFVLQLVSASHNHGHGHNHGHHRGNRANGTLSDAEAILKSAHQAMAVMNKGRVSNPQYNTYELQPDPESTEFELAQVLDYRNGSSIDTTKLRRRQDNGTAAQAAQFTYSIPAELAEAARIVAEANPEPLPGDYGIDIAAEIGQYRPRTNNDTNTPRQKYRKPNGLDTTVPANLTVQEPEPGKLLNKRAVTDFWMTTMEQRGASPFAPDSYKVCVQNVVCGYRIRANNTPGLAKRERLRSQRYNYHPSIVDASAISSLTCSGPQGME